MTIKSAHKVAMQRTDRRAASPVGRPRLVVRMRRGEWVSPPRRPAMALRTRAAVRGARLVGERPSPDGTRRPTSVR